MFLVSTACVYQIYAKKRPSKCFTEWVTREFHGNTLAILSNSGVDFSAYCTGSEKSRTWGNINCCLDSLFPFLLLLSVCDRCIPSLVVLRRRVVLMAAATRVEGLHALKGRGRLRLLRQLGRQSRLGCRRSCWRLQGDDQWLTSASFHFHCRRQKTKWQGAIIFWAISFPCNIFWCTI